MKRSLTAVVAGVALAALIGAGVAAATDGTGPAGRLADVLNGLVSSGTITQDQADEVSDALTESWQQERTEREADRAERKAEIDALLKTTLDLDSDAVRARIAAGETLREIAGESADELAKGMLDLVDQRLDKAVTDGRITQAQADETLTRAKARSVAWLAGEETGMGRGMGLGLLFGPGMGPEGGMRPEGGFGPGGGMGHRGGGQGPGAWNRDAEDDQPESSGSTASSTSWQV